MFTLRHSSLSLSLILSLVSFSLTNIACANWVDPLSSAELQRALQIAQPNASARLSTSSAPDSNTIEILLVERRPAASKNNSTQRLADVYSYDYSSDETIHNIVDLMTNQLIHSERVQSVQLPLTDAELARAITLVFSDPEQRLALVNEFERITGESLISLDQLEVKAFVFHANSLPERLNNASLQCGLNRCAQVLLYTKENVVFEVSPIVNLSAGIMTQMIGF